MGKKSVRRYVAHVKNVADTVKSVAALCNPENCIKIDAHQDVGGIVVVRAEYLIDPVAFAALNKEAK